LEQKIAQEANNMEVELYKPMSKNPTDAIAELEAYMLKVYKDTEPENTSFYTEEDYNGRTYPVMEEADFKPFQLRVHINDLPKGYMYNEQVEDYEMFTSEDYAIELQEGGGLHIDNTIESIEQGNDYYSYDHEYEVKGNIVPSVDGEYLVLTMTKELVRG